MNSKYLNIYNNLIKLTRNKNLYLNLKNKDIFSDRLIILLFHLGFFFKIYKTEIPKKEAQDIFDFVVRQIELSIREIGYGDVSVNKKMKELNKILYDILLKIEVKNDDNKFKISSSILDKYLRPLKNEQNTKYTLLSDYFTKFFYFCFELRLENMIEGCNKFKN